MPRVRSLCSSDGGWALVLVAVALLALAAGVLVSGEAALQATRAASLSAERELALLLAEAGASEGLARAAANLAVLGAPRRVCRTSVDPECGAGSPDYVGCYTYRKSPVVLAGLADCPVPDGVHSALSVYSAYGVGLLRSGRAAQVRMVWSHSGVSAGRLVALEAVR